MTSQTVLTGAAGEHYVLCQLLLEGFIAALAPVGVPNADIVVTNSDGDRQCSIQVKTRRGLGADGGWHMSAKHEELISERYFYCFVDFQMPQKSPARVYVVPSAVVAKVLTESHKQWSNTPGKKGRHDGNTTMRRLLPDYSKVWISENPCPSGCLDDYQDAWRHLRIDK